MNLRKLAKGQECMLRFPSICNRNLETVVLAHIRNQWFSRGSKPPDVCGVWACHACHEVLDGRAMVACWTPDKIDAMVLDALCRQLHWYVSEGVVRW